jgi:hypothetical protein
MGLMIPMPQCPEVLKTTVSIPRKTVIPELNEHCSSTMVVNAVEQVPEEERIKHGKGSLGRMRMWGELVEGV